MLQTAMSNNSTSLSEEATLVSLTGDVSPTTRAPDLCTLNPLLLPISPNQSEDQQKRKKKRNLPGNPDPDAEVIALSPKTLMATNRFVCEICNKGFQRDQNLQLHRRGHNLPWKLRQKNGKEAARKRVYVCPEPTCVHNHPSRALGDLTGIKKHFCRKHGEKIWKCDRCSKRYAVMSDWKAHAKTCGTREYRCDCGMLFSRKDSFVTHRAFCDALAEESARLAAAATAAVAAAATTSTITPLHHAPHHSLPFITWDQLPNSNPNSNITTIHPNPAYCTSLTTLVPPSHDQLSSASTVVTQPQLSATALLQKASIMGCMATSHAPASHYLGIETECPLAMSKNMENRLSTRDFLGGGVAPPSGGQGEVLLSGLALDLVSSPCENNPTTTSTNKGGGSNR